MATCWENSCSFGLRYVSWYKYLIVGLVCSHLGFWSGNLFLIAPFPDLCLLVPFNAIGLGNNVSFRVDTYSNNKYFSLVSISRKPGRLIFLKTVAVSLQSDNRMVSLLVFNISLQFHA